MFGRKKREIEVLDPFDEAILPHPRISVAEMEVLIKRKNSFRLWRLRRDYRWVQRQLRKAGIQPEEARWLL